MAEIVENRKILENLTDYVVFDLETTGLSSVYDKIVEISAVKVINGKITDKYSTLVNPESPMPERASQINGITDDMLVDAPKLEEALIGFKDFVGDMILVGHNIHRFDMGFMDRDYKNLFGYEVSNKYLDTLELAKKCFPDFKSRSLGNLCIYYEIDTNGAHRALADCLMNQKVYELMCKDYFEVENG